MAIEMVCACGRELRFEQALAGGKTRCPICGELLTIPAESQSGQGLPGEPPQRAPKPLWTLMGKSAAADPKQEDAPSPASLDKTHGKLLRFAKGCGA